MSEELLGFRWCHCCERTLVRDGHQTAKYTLLSVQGKTTRVCHACNPAVAAIVDTTLDLLCNPDTPMSDEIFIYAAYGHLCLTGGEELLF